MNIKDEKSFVVYCHTNKCNGKKYIGITCQKLQDRFRNGNGYKSSPHFYNAIKLYGWHNFEHEILHDGLSEEEAKRKEIELISEYNTRNSAYGYNVTPGGEGYSGVNNPWFGKRHSEESKMKMSASRSGVPKSGEWRRKMSSILKGRAPSEEAKRKMSENHADVSGMKNPCYGRKLSNEMIEKLVRASKSPESIEKMKRNKTWYSGHENPNAKSVICIETGKIYGTIKEAAEDTGCNPSKISAVCHGKRAHTRNLHFKILEKDSG